MVIIGWYTDVYDRKGNGRKALAALFSMADCTIADAEKYVKNPDRIPQDGGGEAFIVPDTWSLEEAKAWVKTQVIDPRRARAEWPSIIARYVDDEFHARVSVTTIDPDEVAKRLQLVLPINEEVENYILEICAGLGFRVKERRARRAD